MTAPEVNFSDLSNKPVETVGKLHHSPSRTVRVHRRGDEEDLVLTTASRAAESLENPSPVANLVAAWRHTAEVDADSELLSTLHGDGDDVGPAPEPPAVP